MKSKRSSTRFGLTSADWHPPRPWRGPLGLLRAGLLGASLATFDLAWAGQLEEEWSGTIEFKDRIPAFPLGRSSHKEIRGPDGTKARELSETAWCLGSGRRTISIDVDKGNYSVHLRGYIEMNAQYRSTEDIYQPARTQATCGWSLPFWAPIEMVNPEGTLSVNLEDDCHFSITFDGAHGTADSRYSLKNSSQSACGFVSVSQITDPKDFQDAGPVTTGFTQDPDVLMGSYGSWLQGQPDWCALGIQSAFARLRAATPARQSASLALAQPGDLNVFTSYEINLQRPEGYWAGTIRYTKTAQHGITNAFPYVASRITGQEVDVTYLASTGGFVITLPEDGGTPSARLFEDLTNAIMRTVRAQKTCADGTVMPYNIDEEDSQHNVADQEVTSGIDVQIDTDTFAGEKKVAFIVGRTPSIPEKSLWIHQVDRVDGCGGGDKHERNSGTIGLTFHTEDMRWIAPAECARLQGSKLNEKSGVSETWEWDLRYTHRSGAALTRAAYAKTGAQSRPLSGGPAGWPVALAGGWITCGFQEDDSGSSTVPEGMADAGASYQWGGHFHYAAGITNEFGAGFAATVQAQEASTNHANSFRTVLCEISDGTTQSSTTNKVPASFDTTFSATVDGVVPATVSAVAVGNAYRVHVEISPVAGGSAHQTWHLLTQPVCSEVLPESDGSYDVDYWTSGLRVLDFQGTMDPANPTALVGEAQLAHGWIKWNLRTAVSLALRLTVAPAPEGKLLFKWSGGPGIRLQVATSLANPAWQDVPGTLGATNATVAPGGTAGFFRLLKQ